MRSFLRSEMDARVKPAHDDMAGVQPMRMV
jgi:hypothetical protein